MAITISRADYQQLWQETNPSSEIDNNSNYYEKTEMIPKQLGQGFIQLVQLDGIEISVFNYTLHSDLFVKEEANFSTEWEIGFNLSGNRSGKRSGENFLVWGSYEERGRVWKTYANDPIIKIDLHIESLGKLRQLITEELEDLPPPIRHLIVENETDYFDDINLITPSMSFALEQMLHCPFQGRTKQIYLESKCLELIALKLEQLKEKSGQITRSRTLKPDDIDRIHLAKEILTANLDNPPSLGELAQKVGLNDYKLKQGFREVFGTTVFGCLNRHRMEKARQLLAGQRMNIKEVAQAVGYANQSRFAAAFRKQFGSNPKSFSMRK